MISRKSIQLLFTEAKRLYSEGQVPYRIEEQCRWSYFFLDASKDKLERAQADLETLGYEAIEISDPDDEDKDLCYSLRMDRVEKHSVDSLLALNDQHYKFASDQGLQSYDGMGVDEIDSI